MRALANSSPHSFPIVFLKTTAISTHPSFRSLLFTNVFSPSTSSANTRSTFIVLPLVISSGTFTRVRTPHMCELLKHPDSVTGVIKMDGKQLQVSI